MQNSPLESSENNNKQVLEIAETASVIGSIGCAVASIAFNHAALVSIPLSLSVALNFFNRKQLAKDQNHQLAVISQVLESDTENRKDIADLLIQLNYSEKLLSRLIQEQEYLQEQTISLSRNQDKYQIILEKVVQETQETEQVTVETNSYSEQFYFRRALMYERAGHCQKAIQDYAEVIKLNSKNASAYYNRGKLYSSIGNRQKAAEDLRSAARIYFQQGDLSNYQKLKEMSIDTYNHQADQLNSKKKLSEQVEQAEQVLANNLFS